jgi:hypothetical protein
VRRGGGIKHVRGEVQDIPNNFKNANITYINIPNITMLGSLLLTLSVALTALAGPVPPKPGQVEPGHESIFFVPVKVQDAGLCLDDDVAGNLGEPVTASQCRGDFGSWIWKPLEDGYYHLTLLGLDLCVGFDLRGE